uniref:Uncharacterized protein n=1 Tax=viral metagenome TaxID=1070528 RepID=A0A6C0B4C1_9ZZZZ
MGVIVPTHQYNALGIWSNGEPFRVRACIKHARRERRQTTKRGENQNEREVNRKIYCETI